MDSGGGADDEGLLERFSLSTQLCGAGLHGDAGLGQAWDVYGSLLVKGWLIVEERNSSSSRWDLAVLVKLAAEGHSQVSSSSRNSVSSKQGLSTVKATVPSFADIHVLEARLHTAKKKII